MLMRTYTSPMDKKAYYRAYMNNRYHTRRAEVVRRLGGKCVKCGSTEEIEIDHIDPAKKTFDWGIIHSQTPERIEAEIFLSQLLCKPCHIEKTRVEFSYLRGWNHGTTFGYFTHKCRCPECDKVGTAAKVRYNEQRRIRRQKKRNNNT